MVLSKGRKLILIAAAVVIALAAALLGYNAYRNAQDRLDSAISPLLGGYAYSFADPFDEETRDVFISDYWDPVKDKSSLHKKLVNAVQTQVIDLSFQNAELDSDDRITNEYGEELTDAQDTIVKLMGFLKVVDYEDQDLKDCIQDYYLRLAEEVRTDDAENESSSTEQARELELAEDLLEELEKVDEFNQAAGDFFQIQVNDIIPLDEISGHYTKAIQLARDDHDMGAFVRALSSATASPLLKDETFLSSDEIVDFLMEEPGTVYTLKNGVGGYYDSNRIEGNDVTYYGDFAKKVTTSGGHKYDTSALGGVWDALTPGQKAEITSGNTVHTNYYYYLQGEDYDGELDFSLAEEGYDYVYLNEDGSVLCVSPEGIAYSVNRDVDSQIIYGDFSDFYTQTQESYHPKGDAAAEWQAFMQISEPATQAEYAAYQGAFRADPDGTLQSEFRVMNGQVYWCASASVRVQVEGQEAHSVFLYPALVTDMAATEEYADNTVATATFADGNIHMVITMGGTTLYDKVFTKEA